MTFVNESNFTAATLLVISELLKVRKDVEIEKFQGLNFFSKTLNACNSVDFWTF